MNLSLHSNDFELFGLAERFLQDRAAIDSRWKELQREAHPDRFAAEGAAAQRVAMQWSVRINEGYQRLKDPLKRAAYLCELRGAPIEAENNTAMPAEFLVEQIELREQLGDAATQADIEALKQQLDHRRTRLLAGVEQLLDQAGDAGAAVRQVRALMFIARLGLDIEQRLELLEQRQDIR